MAQMPMWQTPVASVPQQSGEPKRGRRTLVISGIAAVLIVALLATGIAYVLGAFAQHTELDAAKYLPGNTVVFSGVDVFNLAENGFNINLDTLRQSSGGNAGFQQSTGLDWTNDVLPWLGRIVAVGAVTESAGSTAQPGASPVGAIILIQSHDDGKALAAMNKAAEHNVGGDGSSASVTTTTYNGFTLYIQPQYTYDSNSNPSTTPNGSTYTAGKGWAVIGSDPTMAKAAVDRLNGTGDTLSGQQDFQNATSDLPSNRFGTVYVNIRALAALVPASGSSPDLTQFLDTYPTGVGYTSWTSAGLHGQVTFKAAKSLGVSYPVGDAKAPANDVPANAYAYVGINNLGGDLQAGARLFPSNSGSTRAIESLLGVPLSDPALQQPLALTVFPKADGSGNGGALLLNAPDAAAAQALLQSFATANNCTLGSDPSGDASTQALSCPPISLNGILGTSSDTTYDSPTQIAVVAQVKGVLVFASDDASLQAETAVISGGAASLAQSATFKKLVANAPAGAQTLSFANLSSITGFGRGSASSSQNVIAQVSAVLVATVSDNTQSSISVDLALS
jgi:hypothetical protein